MALTEQEYAELRKILTETRHPLPPVADPKAVQRDQGGYPLGIPYPQEIKDYMNLAEEKEINLYAGGRNFKVYRFDANHKEDKPRVYVNIHGGGWALPHEENDFYYSAYLAERIKGIVIDVDYTLSIEAPFDVMHAQCMEAVHYTFAHCAEWGCDPTKVTVGGYSAGGHLAWGVAMKCKEEGLPLYSAVCAYTPFDETKVEYGTEELKGMELRSKTFDDLLFAHDDTMRNTPYANPVSATPEEIRGLSPMMIISAEKCPFRDVDEKFASKLMAAGITVIARRYNTFHGFIPHFMPCWHEATELIAEFICR